MIRSYFSSFASTLNKVDLRPSIARTILLLFLAGAVWAPVGASEFPNVISLDEMVEGTLSFGEPVVVVVRAEKPGTLVVELEGAGDILLLDKSIADPVGIALRGRLSQAVRQAGYYEIAVFGEGPVRLHAWMAPSAPVVTQGPGGFDFSANGDPEEPIEQTEEIENGDPEEPIEQTEEIENGDPEEPIEQTEEIEGGGVVRNALHDEAWLRAACPWAERPELLSTRTCAPHVWLNESRGLTLPGRDEGMVALVLARPGRVTLGDAVIGGAIVTNGGGRTVAELWSGDSVELPAGRSFLRFENAPDGLALEVELD